MNLIKMHPTGYSTGLGHVLDEEGMPHDVLVELPNYPDSPLGREFRKWRVDRDITLGEAARRSGLRVSEVSGLERGRYDLSAEDWKELRRKIGGGA